MPRMMNLKIAVPTNRRMPHFGLGNLYRRTPVTYSPLGNVIRSIGQFFRQTNITMPTPVRSDLTTWCPAAQAGQACPIASPRSKVCPARATGKACPVQSPGLSGRPRMPHFGLGTFGFLGQTYSASGYTVDDNGTISDPQGNAIYVQNSTFGPGSYGPYTVDTDGSVLLGSTVIFEAGGAGLVATSAATSAAVTPTAQRTGSPVPGSAFFNPPVGYAPPPPVAQPASWWDRTTTLFGATLKNSDLAVGGGIAAVLVALSARKKR